MYQRTNNRFALGRLMLTVILLLLCITLVIGATWARYYGEETSYLDYTPREPGTISLWPGYDAESAAPTGGEEEIAWVFSKGVGTLSFCISNSTCGEDYSDEDLNVSIRLLGSLSITDAQVSLSVTEGSSTTVWTATPVQIREGTPLFDTFGGGNAYVFLDEDGAELSWELEGGTLSVLPVQLDVWNLEQAEDAALLQLQVVGN